MNPTQAELLESYARDFSEIPALQTAHRIGYALYGQAGHLWVAVCREMQQGTPRAARCPLSGVDEDAGRGLLRFLYENAVPPEQACDVIQDICGAWPESKA